MSDAPVPRWSNQKLRLNDDKPSRNREKPGSSLIKSIGNMCGFAINRSTTPDPIT
jgi:hypothetical protein